MPILSRVRSASSRLTTELVDLLLIMGGAALACWLLPGLTEGLGF